MYNNYSNNKFRNYIINYIPVNHILLYYSSRRFITVVNNN